MQDKLDYLAKEVGRLHQCNQELQRLLHQLNHTYNDVSIRDRADAIIKKYEGDRIGT